MTSAVNAGRVPLWIVIFLALMTAMITVFTIMGYTAPDIIFAAWPLHAADGAYAGTGPMGFYLGRNIATIVISLYALKARTAGTIRMALLMRAATDAMDGFNFIAGGMSAIMPVVLTAVSLFALWTMRGLKD